jgi:hypothetical protein
MSIWAKKRRCLHRLLHFLELGLSRYGSRACAQCCNRCSQVLEFIRMIREGGCICGAVRFRADGEPLNVRICHCRLCQKAHASPFFARALFEQHAVVVTGPMSAYSSSDALERVFCQQCGTRMFSRRTNGTLIGIALVVFDDRNAFSPTEHVWVSEKVDWLKLNDELPKHAERSPG